MTEEIKLKIYRGRGICILHKEYELMGESCPFWRPKVSEDFNLESYCTYNITEGLECKFGLTETIPKGCPLRKKPLVMVVELINKK